MIIYPMNRIKAWAERTGRTITQHPEGKFSITDIDKRIYKLLRYPPINARPRFRRLASAQMAVEGAY